jgi:hypothetical protein
LRLRHGPVITTIASFRSFTARASHGNSHSEYLRRRTSSCIPLPSRLPMYVLNCGAQCWTSLVVSPTVRGAVAGGTVECCCRCRSPQFSTYNSQSTGPLQFQQSSYYSAPATQAASPASGQSHWYYQAPSSAAAISAIRPSLQHMHSVPSISTTAAYL